MSYTPPAVQRAQNVRTRGGGTTRKYSWPPVEPHEFTVMSVTSILKAIPKEFLVGWAAKVTAEAAIRDHKVIVEMLKGGDKKGAIAHIKGSRYRDMQAKGDRGTIVHAAVDSYLAGKPMSKEEMEQQLEDAFVPDNLRQSTAGMIAGVMEFLWDSEIDVHRNESTVYSREHLYAGTADIIGSLQVGGSVQPAVIDIKTSKAIYNEVALQLCAYARADFVGLNDGTEAPIVPEAVLPSGEPIKYGIVIRPKADGTYERVDFVLNDEVFELFLALRVVADLHLDQDILAHARRPTV